MRWLEPYIVSIYMHCLMLCWKSWRKDTLKILTAAVHERKVPSIYFTEKFWLKESTFQLPCFFPEIDILIFLMDCQYRFGMFLLIIIIILECIKTVSLIFVVPISCLLAFNFHLTFSDNLLNGSFLDQSCILSWTVFIWSFSFLCTGSKELFGAFRVS